MTLRAWLRRGDEEEIGLYADLAQAVAAALADMKIRNVALIADAGDGDWRAAAWLLERRFPAEFGSHAQVRLQVEAEVASMLDTLRNVLSEADYARALAALSTARTATDDERVT